jgi:hypothetical protein
MAANDEDVGIGLKSSIPPAPLQRIGTPTEARGITGDAIPALVSILDACLPPA